GENEDRVIGGSPAFRGLEMGVDRFQAASSPDDVKGFTGGRDDVFHHVLAPSQLGGHGADQLGVQTNVFKVSRAGFHPGIPGEGPLRERIDETVQKERFNVKLAQAAVLVAVKVLPLELGRSTGEAHELVFIDSNK